MNKRQIKIYEMLQAEGEITIRRLAEVFKVSEMTVYRDAAEMEKKGILYKKRGALVYNETAKVTTGYLPEKKAIAKKAAELIAEGDSVLFDNSTTALEVARLISFRKNITVYSTNLEVAGVVCGNPDITLYVGGGYYSHASTGLVGSLAEAFVEQLHPDKCIVGTSGIHPDFGFTGPYPNHSSLEKKIMAAAEEVIVVADHTKFGKVAMEKIADIGQANYIITDDAVEQHWLDVFSDKTTIIVAAVDNKRKK